MIARIWRGVVRREDRDAYADYIRDTGLAGYEATPGNRGAWMLRRDVGDRTEFVTFTLWESLDAIRAPSPARTSRPRSTTPRTTGTSSSATTPSRTTR